MRVRSQTKDSRENEQQDNSVVGVKMLNIEAGRAHGAFPGNRPAARAQATLSLTPRYTHKKHTSHFLYNALSHLISTFRYDKAPIMMFHSHRFNKRRARIKFGYTFFRKHR